MFLRDCDTSWTHNIYEPHSIPVMGGAIGGYGGDKVPPTFGTSGVQGVYRGAVQWKWSLLLQQTVFIQYCTNDWFSTPLALVDTCQVNDIWKDGLGRVYTVHPHWTATLFKSTCQHAHVAVYWLSMSLSRTYLPSCQISLATLAGSDPWGHRGHVPPKP